MSKVVHDEQSRQKRHGLRGGGVREGYEGDDRGVVPSKVRTGLAQKQGLDPPADPKRETFGCRIAKKKNEALGRWDKVGGHEGQTDEYNRGGVQGNRPKRKGATDQKENVILLGGRTSCMGEGKKRGIL